MKATDQKLMLQACGQYEEYRRALEGYHQRIEDYRRLHRAALADDQRRKSGDDLLTSGTWMHSTCENIKADIVDNYPEAVVYPQQPDDRELADMLGTAVRYVLDRREYEDTFMRKLDDEIQCGTSVLEVFWNTGLCSGQGDVDIRHLDIRSFYWDPNVTDIQHGRSVIKELVRPLEWFALHYPDAYTRLRTDREWTRQVQGKLRDGVDGDRFAIESQLMIGRANRDPKAGVLMLEYWYKTPGDGLPQVHCAKIAGGCVLYDSREDFPQGVYDDGDYPFLMTPYFPDPMQAHGHGVVEVFRQTARYIDKLERLQLRNIVESARQRKLVREGSGIDMNRLRDMEEDIIPVSNPDSCVLPLPSAQPLSSAAYTLYASKISLLKDESGQNQFNRGEGGKGVTAASAIIALQEAGNKRMRMAVKRQYAAHRLLIRMVIRRILQFYDGQRVYLLRGNRALTTGDTALTFDPAKYLAGKDKQNFDFDIDIEAQIATPANKVYHNETVFQMFSIALQYGEQPELLEAMMSMLDMPRKDELMLAVRKLWAQQAQARAAQAAQQQQVQQVQQAAAAKDAGQVMAAFPELFAYEGLDALETTGTLLER